ncbi:FGGY-family carbohydrate kinase [Paramicrobacterium agarici]|uniref:FGGY-family carbohydrate kinase n=1 Tax=Paramicrobacterium agarici TaxID=630514 RepID=UPI00115251AE|nr:FGGY-family carbohydrate kinase [Microbacterium agarici]TQO22932.1 xylulokinase/erythritol kinase [Microbacterium agarici]
MILGIDIGTSVTKAALIDRDGTSHHHASTSSALIKGPDGQVEQDLDDVMDSVARVAREVVHAASDPIDAVAITAQGDGLWLRDAEGRAVRNPMSWMDARASSIVARWGEGGANSVTERVFRLTGSGVFPGSHAGLLAWLSQHEPESLEKAAVSGYCADAVLQRLTGEITVDASDASLPFLNVTTREYVTEALELCGIAQWQHLLPAPAAVDKVFTLDAAGAELLGLPAGTPVSSGPYDLQACSFGAGTEHAGDGTVIIGTTLACQVFTRDTTIRPEFEPAGMWLCTPDPHLYLRVMPSMVGTAGIDWMLSMFQLEPSDLTGLLEQSPPGANGVRALSFLSPAGERAPFVDPLARGQFTGLTIANTRAEVVRALCESVVFAARHCLEVLGFDGELSASGGGVRSTAWAQLLADTMGTPIWIPHEAQVGIRGAAQVAWKRLGTPVDTDAWRQQRTRLDPNPDAHAALNAVYREYLAELGAARARWNNA